MLFIQYEGSGLDKIIYKDTVPLQSGFIYPQYKKGSFKQVDADKLVVDLSGINYLELLIWGIPFLVMFIWPLLPNFKSDDFLFGKILYYFVVIVLFILILNCFFENKKKFVFNRKEGTVTYPTFWFFTETVPFSDAIMIHGAMGLRSMLPGGLAFVSQNRRHRSFIHFAYPYAMLSFYVWYMDKNRPLPLGTAFDTYREADYLRRRSEGFPVPLYPSAIETPEWEGAVSTYNDKDALDRGTSNYDPSLGASARIIEGELPKDILEQPL